MTICITDSHDFTLNSATVASASPQTFVRLSCWYCTDNRKVKLRGWRLAPGHVTINLSFPNSVPATVADSLNECYVGKSPFSPNVAVEWLAFLCHVHVARVKSCHGDRLSWLWYSWFLRGSLGNSGKVPQIIPRPFPSTFLPGHYSLIIQCCVWTADSIVKWAISSK
jgi:hypothetical protein